jgi:hypothetical protein
MRPDRLNPRARKRFGKGRSWDRRGIGVQQGERGGKRGQRRPKTDGARQEGEEIYAAFFAFFALEAEAVPEAGVLARDESATSVMVRFCR